MLLPEIPQAKVSSALGHFHNPTSRHRQNLATHSQPTPKGRLNVGDGQLALFAGQFASVLFDFVFAHDVIKCVAQSARRFPIYENQNVLLDFAAFAGERLDNLI